MTAERWRQIKTIFDAAVETDPAFRQDFLRQHCAGDEALLREVESLLASDQDAESLLEHPVVDAVARAAAARSAESTAGPPRTDYTAAPLDSSHALKNRYDVERELGRGGMSVVYLARDRELLDRRVVIKVLLARSSTDPWIRHKFLQEMEALARIDHPGVVGVLDTGSTAEGKQFLVMQYIEGETLRRVIEAGPVDFPRAAKLIRQIGQALAAAHEKGVWHRDLKPANIMVQRLGGEDHVKVIDFGIAGVQNSEFLGEESKVAGTLSYMAPEQFAGHACAASDTYSLAVVSYELLTGTLPRQSGDLQVTLNDTARRVILKALSFDPQLRHPTIRDFSEELYLALTSVTTGESGRVAPLAVEDVRETSRQSRWNVVRASILAVMLVAAALALYRNLRPPPTLTARDTIVVAGFTNSTGDPVFDGTLQKNLALKLAESPFLNILSEEDVGRTLKMMGRDANDRVTPQLGREICTRNGLKAVVSGSIGRLGNTYAVNLDATNCATGESLARAGTEASGKDSVLRALGKAAVEVRRKLGESLSSIQKFDKLDMTSSSLPALQAYVMAQKANMKDRPKDQLALLNHAIELDPKFTLAYVALSALYSNQHQSDKAAEIGRKAFDLRDRVTEREKFVIEDRYYGVVTGELDKRIASDTVWSLTYPRDAAAFLGLSLAHGAAGNYEKALAAALETLRLNPEVVAPYKNIIGYYAGLGRFDDARRAVDAAQQHKIPYRRLLTNAYELAFIMHDSAAMEKIVRDAMQMEGGSDEILFEEAMTEAYYGRLHKSQAFFDRAIDAAEQAHNQSKTALCYAARAHVEALLGLVKPARDDAQSALKLAADREVLVLAAWALARAGDFARASTVEEDLARRYPLHALVNSRYLPALRGDLAIAENKPERAIDGLRAAIPYEWASSPPATGPMYATYVRGQAYLRAHQASAAQTEFQKILDHPGITSNSPLDPLAHLGLAQAYALVPDAAKRSTECQAFFALWKDADPTLPILTEARATCPPLK